MLPDKQQDQAVAWDALLNVTPVAMLGVSE